MEILVYKTILYVKVSLIDLILIWQLYLIGTTYSG